MRGGVGRGGREGRMQRCKDEKEMRDAVVASSAWSGCPDWGTPSRPGRGSQVNSATRKNQATSELFVFASRLRLTMLCSCLARY